MRVISSPLPPPCIGTTACRTPLSSLMEPMFDPFTLCVLAAVGAGGSRPRGYRRGTVVASGSSTIGAENDTS